MGEASGRKDFLGGVCEPPWQGSSDCELRLTLEDTDEEESLSSTLLGSRSILATLEASFAIEDLAHWSPEALDSSRRPHATAAGLSRQGTSAEARA